MTSLDEIRTKFLDMNVALSGVILNKCFEICNKYNLEAEDFCDEWYAFTVTNLAGAAPTVEYLEQFERKKFHNPKAKNKNIMTPKSSMQMEIDSNSTNLVSSYGEETQKQQKPAVQVLPPSRNISVDYEDNESNTSFSKKYSQRTDALVVQCEYGTKTDFKRVPYQLSINNIGNALKDDFTYQFDVLGKRVEALSAIAEDTGHSILAKNELQLSEGFLKINLGEVVTYGRIVSDSGKKFNQQSVLLEGTHETNANCTTMLNLNPVSRYSLFPGQIVAIKGNNANSTMLVAETIYSNAVLEFPNEPPVISDKMQIIVATGPFTLPGSLSYDPLHDLLNYVKTSEPNLLILMGPFLDSTHDGILNMNQTFGSFFEGLIENIMDSLMTIDIEVVIVASLKDAHHHPVYPTPPYKIPNRYPNLTFVADPCMFSVNGLVIGATGADILFDMSKFELFCDKNPTGPPDRMGRMASHLLNQRNFYPLLPANKDINFDLDLHSNYGLMTCKPHILILPSNLKHFVKNINDCLVINPERLTKCFVAGTFARIEVRPGSTTSICDRVTCQILRI